ncbi:MAG: hypothetical protein KKF89_02065 [Nanoarchaeota archaeon]|nr:hypothetical protein [Nanoarchaeota archaeon]MBU1854479.1 hypothetical protein [Nanoarchaeota archaeon]
MKKIVLTTIVSGLLMYNCNVNNTQNIEYNIQQNMQPPTQVSQADTTNKTEYIAERTNDTFAKIDYLIQNQAVEKTGVIGKKLYEFEKRKSEFYNKILGQ